MSPSKLGKKSPAKLSTNTTPKKKVVVHQEPAIPDFSEEKPSEPE